jgi:hypothetical protein
VVARYRYTVLSALMALAMSRLAHAGDDPDEPKEGTEAKDAKAKEADAKDADKGDADAKDADKGDGEKKTGHGFQFGLRAGFAFGYKMIFRYPESPFCRSYDPGKTVGDQQKVCGFMPPPGIEVALSFALTDGLEPYVFGRFGFAKESETDTKPQQLYGAGIRIYTMSDGPLKVYIEPGVAFAAEGGAGNPTYALNKPEYKTDLIFHAAAGPQYDFSKFVGIFLNAGLDVGVLRSINATLLANIGAQVRLP